MYDGHLQFTDSPKPFLGILEKNREEEESSSDNEEAKNRDKKSND